jgi:hypothetical protein
VRNKKNTSRSRYFDSQENLDKLDLPWVPDFVLLLGNAKSDGGENKEKKE